ncbi:phage tail protein, partial [Acinetobacter baumannii]
RQSAQVAVDQSSANAEAIDSINLELDDKASTGALDQVKSDIKNVDDKVNAQTIRLDGVYAQINPPLIGSESDLIGNEGGYAGVWSEQSARIEGDLAQAKLTEQLSAQMNENNAVFKRQLEANSSAISSTIKVTETLQTKVGENSASIQNVSESVDGIYAQQFTKFDVNGHVSGHGSMNDGTTSTFIFNYDAIQFGTPVGVDGVEPKPLMTLQNNPITLPNGTVIPRGLYVDNGSFGYINANRIWAENLSVISADLGTIKVKTANIEDGAIDTLKIQDEAVTVPVGVNYSADQTYPNAEIYTRSHDALGAGWGSWPTNFESSVSLWEAGFGTIGTITLNRKGGKALITATACLINPSAGNIGIAVPNGSGYLSAAERKYCRMVLSVYRGTTLVARTHIMPSGADGNSGIDFNGTLTLVAVDDSPITGTVTYTMTMGAGYIGPRSDVIVVPQQNSSIRVTGRSMSIVELKK